MTQTSARLVGALVFGLAALGGCGESSNDANGDKVAFVYVGGVPLPMTYTPGTSPSSGWT